MSFFVFVVVLNPYLPHLKKLLQIKQTCSSLQLLCVAAVKTENYSI